MRTCGERAHSCQWCDKKFIQKSNLTNHLRVHTGEKPFSCDECGKKYTRKSNLNAHVRKFHPEPIEESSSSISSEFFF